MRVRATHKLDAAVGPGFFYWYKKYLPRSKNEGGTEQQRKQRLQPQQKHKTTKPTAKTNSEHEEEEEHNSRNEPTRLLESNSNDNQHYAWYSF